MKTVTFFTTKKWMALIPLFILSLALSAQTYTITNSSLNVGNPGGLRTASDATSTGGTVIQAYNNGSSSTNLWSDPYAIPFTFNFYGSPVTHLMVSKNGLLTFDTTNTGMTLPASIDTNSALPNANLPNNTIAYFWDDMASTLGSNDQVYAIVEGTSPNRQLWILNFSYYLSTSSFNYFAVVLEETTDKIYVVDMNYANSATSISATIGIQINGTTVYEVSTPLNGTNGSPNIIMGPGSSGAADNEYYEFNYLAAGACVPPTDLSVGSITSTGATASWVSGGAANSYVEYGLTGFLLGSGSNMYVNDTSATLTSLASNTTYDVYVKDSCATNASTWVGPVTFTTLCASQVTGTVTINPALPASSTNFQSFNAFANEVNACGIGGAVTVNVAQGTYNERVEFTAITGASSTNTITIQPNPANTMPVILTDSSTTSTDNYVMHFNGTSWITVDGITMTNTGASYSTCVEFSGTNDQITIQNCTLNAAQAGSTSTNHIVVYDNTGSANKSNHISILNNEINNGSYGVYLYGVSTTDYENGHVISGNSIHDFYYYGIRVYYADSAAIQDNDIVMLTAGYSTGYGIYNGYSDNCSVTGNKVVITPSSTAYGIYNYYNDASASMPNLIANNMVSCIGNSGSTYAIYPFNNYYTNVYYNSINVTAGSTTAGRALYINSSSSGTYGFVNLMNNNVSNTGGGYAAEISSSAVTLGYVTSSDYNNIYGTGSTLIRVGSSNYTDLGSYQTATMMDSNSVSSNPLFVAPDDLHTVSPDLDGAAMPIAGITTDIDGDTRDILTPDIGADEFVAASCVFSTDLGATGITSSTASLYWTSISGATNWVIEYDTAGFTQGMGTTIFSTNDTVAISGLMAQTAYDFYVKDSCGPTSTSPWAGPFTFTTACSAISTFPYTEGFEGSSWTIPSSACNYSDGIDPCWSRIPNGYSPMSWVMRTGSTCSGSTGPTGANSGSNYVYLETSSSGSDAELWMQSLDVTSLTSPELRFYYHMYGATIGTLYTEVSTDGGTSWTTLDSIVGAQQSSDTDAWLERVVNMSSYTGTITIRFRGTYGGSFTGDISIDDITVDEAPACQAPTFLGAYNIGTNSADIFWTPGGSASYFNIEYGPAGFTQGTGMMMTVMNDSTTLSSLFANTAYDFYVRDSCSASDQSAWSGPYTFNTLCNTFVAPFTETFESSSTSTDCWSQEYVTGTNDWSIATGSSGGVVTTAYAGSLNARFTSSSGGPHITIAISPVIDVSGLTSPQLDFAYAQEVWAGDQNYLNVYYRDSANGAWNYVWSDSTNKSAWTLATVAIPSTSSTLQLGFEGVDNWGRAVVVDEIMLADAPTCPAPTNLGSFNITATSAQIYWTGSGSGIGYTIEYGPSGFIPGTGLTIPSANDTATLSGLISNTSYDFYVQDSCGATLLSTVSGPSSFSTLCNTFTAPFLEDFETSTGTTGCWSQTYVTGTKDWTFATGSSGGVVTSAYSGTLNARFTSSSGGPHITRLISPVVDASALTGTELSFAYAQEVWAGDQNFLNVYYRDSANGAWNFIWSDSTSQAAWVTEAIIIPSTSATLQVAFEGIDDWGRANVVDDVEIKQAPSCPPSTNLSVTNVTATSADVYWTSVSNASYFIVEYGPTGFIPCTGIGTVVVSNNDTLTITNLVPNTTYDYYVIDSCSTQSSGCPGAGPFTFSTLCNTFTAPFVEDFEVSTGTSGCWSQNYIAGTSDWSVATGSSGGSVTTANSGSLNMRHTSSSGTPKTTMLISPIIDASALTMPELTFAYAQETWAGDQNYLDVFYRDSASGAWNHLWSDSTDQASWTTIMLSLPTTSSTLQVGFRATDNWGRAVVVDDVTIANAGSCATPDTIVASAGCSDATISWTSEPGASTSIEYGPTGFTQGAGTIMNGVSSPLMLSNLTLGMAYDFYLLDTCTNNASSSWSAVTTFTTDTMPIASFMASMNASPHPDTVQYGFDASATTDGTAYSWDYGDGTSGGTGVTSIHNYSQNGTFTVTLIVTNACGADTVTQSVTITGIGIDEYGFGNIGLYPNPNSGVFNLTGLIEFGTDVTLDVISANGAILYSQKVNGSGSETIEVDVQGLPPGFYQIRVSSSKGIGVKPFVIRN